MQGGRERAKERIKKEMREKEEEILYCIKFCDDVY